mmetsp:Transcript_19596/g.25363  ORF Transcript_19596/g.25363 Transcript_19596/m.25363 type:complete len:397 (-) Transcript_19596:127-1317(-)
MLYQRSCLAVVFSVWGGAYSYSAFPVHISRLTYGQKRLFSRIAEEEEKKKRLVFLGSPGVAAKVLEALVVASRESEMFKIVACVSQPPAAKGRKKIVQKSETHIVAEELEIKSILTPASARDDDFLNTLRHLKPDLCITAAYGQFLPQKFLEIPEYGTWNIHPSLLPRWRGAAPLQRSLEAGDAIVGVTVLQTVLKMDAGPIVCQTQRAVNDDDACDVLLEELFLLGTKLLIDALPQLWDGSIQYIQQDEQFATNAPKIHSSEAKLNLWPSEHSQDTRCIAQVAYDKLRAFTPWPGTWISVTRLNSADAPSRLKVIEARIGKSILPPPINRQPDDPIQLSLTPDNTAIMVPCGDGSVLELTKVQPANRKPMDAGAYWNGLRGEPLYLLVDNYDENN